MFLIGTSFLDLCLTIIFSFVSGESCWCWEKNNTKIKKCVCLAFRFKRYFLQQYKQWSSRTIVNYHCRINSGSKQEEKKRCNFRTSDYSFLRLLHCSRLNISSLWSFECTKIDTRLLLNQSSETKLLTTDSKKASYGSLYVNR